MPYNFTATWLKGQQNNAADALSRHPVAKPDLAEYEVDHAVASKVRAISIHDMRDAKPTTNLRLQEVLQHASEDTQYQTLKQIIQDGFPNYKQQLPALLQHFWSMKQHLSVDDNLIVFGCRLLIPVSLRPTLLSCLHESHQGVVARSQQ